MNKFALLHRPKSEYAYAYDHDYLHILIRTKKSDVNSVILRYGDPFLWDKTTEKHQWVYHDVPMILRYQTQDYDFYFAEIKPDYKRVQYAFILTDDKHRFSYSPDGLLRLLKEQDISSFFKFPYLNQDDLHQTPSWVKDQIWYQIFPDRFSSETVNGFDSVELPMQNMHHYGGTLKGIIKRLDYIKDLGFTAIYLTPVFESPSAHKYDTADYFKIDHHFGSLEDLKALVDRAHELQMKVILDGVFNHAGFFHPFFQDVIQHGENSIYKDCFYIESFPVVNFPLNPSGKPINYNGIPLRYRTFSFQPSMPKWNTSHPLVEKHLLDAVAYWIEKTDIDGWRLDVSNEISHDFLRKIKHQARSVKPESFILGENWDESLPWLLGDQLDSVMNYELSYMIWDYLTHQTSTKHMIDRLTYHHAKTPKNVMAHLFNLLGSHDTMRIKHRLNEDSKRVVLAYLLMFLSPGTPMVYYGDEIGLTGGHDPDNRRLFSWDQSTWNTFILDHIRKMIALRKKYPHLFTSDFHFIEVPDVLVFTKNYENQQLLCIINRGTKQTIEIDKKLQGTYQDLILEQKNDIRDKIEIEPSSFYLLLKEDF